MNKIKSFKKLLSRMVKDPIKNNKKWIEFGIALGFCLFAVSRLGFFNPTNAYWVKACLSIKNFFQFNPSKPISVEHFVPIPPLEKLTLLLFLGFFLGSFLPSYSWKKFIPWMGYLFIGIYVFGFAAFALKERMINVIPLSVLVLIFSGTLFLFKTLQTEAALLDKLKEWQKFNRLSQLQTQDFTLDELLESALNLTQEILPATNAAGILLKDSEGRLVLQAASGITPVTEDQLLNPHEGICGKIADEGKGICLENFQTLPSTSKFERNLKDPYFASVPLISKNQILGILWANSSARPYHQKDLISLSFIASQIAAGVQNSLLSQSLNLLYLDSTKALLRAVEFYQPSTRGHGERVARYALMLGKAANLSAEELETIHSAALLHDIGKMGHFDVLYRKQGGITEEDWKQILVSVKIGLKILQPLSGKSPFLPILYHFYERFDGKGFPDKLKGEQIPIGSRILAVANAFDDISSTVPLFGQVSMDRAVQEIKKEAGTLFDPALVRFLIQNLSYFPASEVAKTA